MPKLNTRLPRLCRDRKLAISWHNGKRIYHGVWGTPDATKNYKRFIAALLESPTLPLRMDKDTDVLVSELATAFLDTHEGKLHTSHVRHFKQAIGYLVEVYGELAVNEFSPKKLKVVREQMRKGKTLCRRMINDYVGNIKRIFAWGVEEEIVQPNVAFALKAVKNFRQNEEGVFDHPEKEDVPLSVVSATLPFLAPVVAVMVQIQWMLGMRPNEVFRMRVGDIDRSRNDGLWYYVPGSYKTAEFVGKIVFPLGEPVQRLLAPYLIGKKPMDSVFSPRTAMKERATQAREDPCGERNVSSTD